MKDTPGRGRTAFGVACAVLLLGCGPAAGQTQDVVATPSSVQAVGLPTVGATDLQAPEGGVLYDLAATDGRVVGVGVAAGRAAVWSLDADGAWSEQQVPAIDVPRLDAVALTDVTAVAFGGDGLRPSRLLVADGDATWREVDADASGIDGRVTGVTIDGDRVIAVGDRVDPESGESYQGVVWASDDGRSFTPVTADLPLAEGTLSDVAARDDVVVVVGFDTSGGRVWTATGGAAFEAAATGPFAASTIEGVAATGDGFVAVGRGLGDLELRTWTSDDGRRWRRADVDGGDIRPEDEVHGMTAVDGVVVTVGGTADGATVWTLDDEGAWRGNR